MASSNNAATKAFFKSGYGIMLAVYDTRRGQQEGREADKILAFYPPTAPAIMQSSIVGLAQALTMFAGWCCRLLCLQTGVAHTSHVQGSCVSVLFLAALTPPPAFLALSQLS